MSKAKKEKVHPAHVEETNHEPAVSPLATEPIAAVPEPEPITSAPINIPTIVEAIPPAQEEQSKPVLPIDPSLSKEDRIIKYLESRKTEGFVKINDFLKSLYPLPKLNEPAKWLDQGENKRLRILLNTMQSEAKIKIQNNQHLKLGTFYYDGSEPQTRYHNLQTVIIEARL